MDGSYFYDKRNNNSGNEMRMEVEQTRSQRHSNFIQSRLSLHRNLNLFPVDKSQSGSSTPGKRPPLSTPFNASLINSNINEVINLFNELPLYGRSSTNFSKINSDQIHTKILDCLKIIRKEFSKENISEADFKSILTNKTPVFIDLLINPFKDTNHPYIQLESLWIINNMLYVMGKNNINCFDLMKISSWSTQLLITNYKTIQNEGVRNTLIEKIFRIFGNLISLNNGCIKSLIESQGIPFIIDCLNTSISSFRTCCLWLLNKILLTLEKVNLIKNNLQDFISKNAIVNYKFIMSRLANQRNVDEIGELFWLFNELVKFDTNFLNPIFFMDSSNIKMNMPMTDSIINNCSLTNSPAIKNFSFILENFHTTKVCQASIRLISNLITVCPDENLVVKFIEIIFGNQSFIIYINDIMNNYSSNKYDRNLLKDTLLLIFNLICISSTKSIIHFKKGIVNLISDRECQNDNDIMRLLFYAYYRILVTLHFSFEPNDERAVKSVLFIMTRFSNEETMLIIFIDILFNYLIASHTNIDEEVKNYVGFIIQEKNKISIDKYQIILEKLFHLIKIHSPLSKFMKGS